MKTSVEATGKNIEQAIENALFELKAPREDVDIKILTEGGLFKKAKVVVTISDDVVDKYEKREQLKKQEEEPEKPVEVKEEKVEKETKKQEKKAVKEEKKEEKAAEKEEKKLVKEEKAESNRPLAVDFVK